MSCAKFDSVVEGLCRFDMIAVAQVERADLDVGIEVVRIQTQGFIVR